jgi:chorismate synthase
VRVAAGAIARKYLRESYNVTIRGCMTQMGPLRAERWDWGAVEHNPFFFPDPAKVPELEKFLDKLREDGDSIGARIMAVAQGVPPGWGEPVYERMDSDLAAAMMSINAVKGVEIGSGFASVEQRGSQHRDEMTPQGFLSNNAGGILGGITSGQDVVVHLALKPTSSIRIPGRTIDRHGRATEISTKGRHDPCVGIRAVPIAEAMLALVLMDHMLRHRAQNAHVKPETPIIPAAPR